MITLQCVIFCILVNMIDSLSFLIESTFAKKKIVTSTFDEIIERTKIS